MPSSHPYQIISIIRLIQSTNPNSILDIGIGSGKYGFLSREYLESYNTNVDTWEKIIDGIEGYEKYLTPVQKFVYNNIFIGNAVDIVPTLEKKYDLIMMIDVFEHFEYNEGLNLLKECKKKCKNILISVPKKLGNQGIIDTNHYEIHKTQWHHKDFAIFPDKFFVPNNRSIICFAGEDAKRVKKYMGPFRSIYRKIDKINKNKICCK